MLRTLATLPAMEATADAERAAWDALVRRHERRVLVALLADGLSLEQARDVAQDAWARLWEQQRAGRLRELELPGLAITQARFLARDSQRRARSAPFDAREADAAQPGASAEARLSSAQTLSAVRRELRALPFAHQRVFELAQEGLPHAEIAQRLGVTTHRVRQLVWEVRSRLRAHFGDEP